MKFIKRKMRLAFYLFVKSCQLSLNIIIYFQAYLNLLVIAICVPLWYLKENLQKKKTTKKRIRGKSNNWNSITPKANVMFHLTALGWFEGHLRFCQRNNMLLDCFGLLVEREIWNDWKCLHLFSTINNILLMKQFKYSKGLSRVLTKASSVPGYIPWSSNKYCNLISDYY